MNTVGANIRLPVFSTVGEAYVFVWRQRTAFWVLAVPAIVIMAISYALHSWATGGIGPGSYGEYGDYGDFAVDWAERGGLAWFVVINLAMLTVSMAVLVLYSVAWHRHYLALGEALSARTAWRWRPRQTRFLINYVKIGLLLFLLSIPLVLVMAVVSVMTMAISPATEQGSGPMAMIGFGLAMNVLLMAVVLWVFARLSMLFPATAVDNHMSVRAGWRFSRHNGWRLFWIIALAAVPVWIVSTLIGLVFTVLGIQIDLYGSLTAMLLSGLVFQFLGFIGIATGVSALSISYKRLIDARTVSW